MSQVNQVNPDGRPNPMNPTGQHVHVPTREQANERQIHTALAVVNCLQPYLLCPHRSDDDDFKREHPELDGGSVASATRTFESVCTRLEKMMGEESRWSVGDPDSLVASIKETQASIRRYYAAQETTVSEMRRPSRIFHPHFMVLDDGKFAAYYTSSDFPGGIIVGLGATPAAAMEDFDNAFNRIPAEQIQFSAESLAKIHAAGVEPKTPPAPALTPRKQPRRKK